MCAGSEHTQTMSAGQHTSSRSPAHDYKMWDLGRVLGMNRRTKDLTEFKYSAVFGNCRNSCATRQLRFATTIDMTKLLKKNVQSYMNIKSCCGEVLTIL